MSREPAGSRLQIEVEGATAEQLARGARAAAATFVRAGVTEIEAAQARFDIEMWDIGGFPEPAPSSRDFDRMAVWEAADQAAVEVCCAGWDADRIPETAYLSIITWPR